MSDEGGGGAAATRGDGRLAAVVCLVAAMFGFGVIPIFLRHFADRLDPWTVNGIRYSVGAVFWLPFVLLLERRTGAGAPGEDRGASALSAEEAIEEATMSPGDNPGEVLPPPAGTPDPQRPNVWRDALVPSVVNILGQVGFGVSPYFVMASTLGFVTRLSFLFTIMFGFAFLAEERRLAGKAWFWLGAAVSMAGVLMMFLEKLMGGGRESLIGLTIIVLTALAWGGYSVSVRQYMAPYPVRQSFGVISLYTSAALVLLMLLFGRVASLAQIDAGLWLNLMASALLGIAFGHVLYYRGIHRLGPVVSSGIMLATPFVTYLGAAVCLGERLSGMELAGGLAVVAGGALLVGARAQVERDTPAD